MTISIETITHEIQKIKYKDLPLSDTLQKSFFLDGKLELHFDLHQENNPTFKTMQRELLRMLKQELKIPKVKLQFLPEQPKEDKKYIFSPYARFINILSGKGGVGKSTATVELAYALSKLGKKVAIIDADVYGSSIPKIMHILPTRPQIVEQKVLPFSKDNIQLISASLLISENNPVIWRGPMLGKLLRQFFTDIAWADDTDIFLIDMPPGTGDILLDLNQIIPQLFGIVVTTPQEDAAFVAVKAGLAAIELGQEIIGVIENMAYTICEHCNQKTYPFGKEGGLYVSSALTAPILEQLPLIQKDKKELKNEYEKKYQQIAHYIIEKGVE